MEIESEPDLSVAKTLMNSADAQERIEACNMLVRFANGIDQLEILLIDEDPHVRSAAVEAASLLDDSDKVLELVAPCINDTNPFVIQSVLLAMKKYGDLYGEEDRVLRLARHKNERTRALALKAIGAARLPGKERYLLEVLKSAGWKAREGAAGGLRLFGEPSTVNEIVKELQKEVEKDTKNRVVMKELIRCLHTCDAQPDQLPILIQILKFENGYRSDAAKVIGALRYEAAREALEESLSDKSEKLVKASLTALIEIGPNDSIGHIRALLFHPHQEVVSLACKCCGISQDEESLAELRGLTFSTKYSIRFEALIAIERIDVTSAQRLALLFLDDHNVKIQQLAADILQRNPPDEALEPFSIDELDLRSRILSEIALREGQEAFKRKLVIAHGASCMVSGCSVEEVIEAAHIKPYRGIFDNSVGNGLLLRADFHKLFDDGLIGVHPETLEIRIASQLLNSEYGKYHGVKLRVGDPSLLEGRCLQLKWSEFVGS